MHRSIQLHPAARPRRHAGRRAMAWALRRASACLARLARHVHQPVMAAQRRSAIAPVVEFHAEAGAPEGALYVDGELIGHLDVSRL